MALGGSYGSLQKLPRDAEWLLLKVGGGKPIFRQKKKRLFQKPWRTTTVHFEMEHQSSLLLSLL